MASHLIINYARIHGVIFHKMILYQNTWRYIPKYGAIPDYTTSYCRKGSRTRIICVIFRKRSLHQTTWYHIP